MPGDGDGAYRTHEYRDLFAEAGHSPAETRANIEKAFQQLFHGDGQEERVYFETGANENGPLAYITDWANNDARTEGMSYGMMIAVQMDKKREFDAIWNWAKTYMLITDPKNPSVGYFAWSMSTDGSPRSTGAAPDGEEYFVMALYFAAHRWGNGKGIYDYQAEADKILHGMRHHPVLTATGPFRIHPDDAPFVPPNHPWPSPNNTAREREAAAKGEHAASVSRSLGSAQRFHRPHGGRRALHDPLRAERRPWIHRPFVPSAGVLRTVVALGTGGGSCLLGKGGRRQPRSVREGDRPGDRSDSRRRPGSMRHRSMHQDGTATPFGYDSWRSVSNWSVDYSWWRKDAREAALSDRIQKFLNSQGITTFVDRYTLDGKPLSTRHSTGMVATAAVGSLATTTGPTSRAFVEELWNSPVPSGEQRYYDGMLYLMSMLHCSGNFRIIDGPLALQAHRAGLP